MKNGKRVSKVNEKISYIKLPNITTSNLQDVVNFLDDNEIEYVEYYAEDLQNRIDKAIEYIEKNITQNFTLETLCNQLYINKSHLHRLFLKHLQITPKKYITSKRLEFAQKLLRRGAKPIDVYLYCGFSEYSTFFRDYKKHFGYSPSQEADKKIKREIRF